MKRRRGANINATPQTTDVAPITNLTLTVSTSRLLFPWNLERSKSLFHDSQKGKRNKEEYGVFRLTRPDVAYLPTTQALCLSHPTVVYLPSPTRVGDLTVGEQVECIVQSRKKKGGRTIQPTRHEFSKRFSHFVRLNLARGVKGQSSVSFCPTFSSTSLGLTKSRTKRRKTSRDDFQGGSTSILRLKIEQYEIGTRRG